MKNRKLLQIIWLFLFIPLACEDFLEKPPHGELTQSNFPLIAGDALLATNAVYNTMRESNFNSGLFPLYDIMSDDAHKSATRMMRQLRSGRLTVLNMLRLSLPFCVGGIHYTKQYGEPMW